MSRLIRLMTRCLWIDSPGLDPPMCVCTVCKWYAAVTTCFTLVNPALDRAGVNKFTYVPESKGTWKQHGLEVGLIRAANLPHGGHVAPKESTSNQCVALHPAL